MTENNKPEWFEITDNDEKPELRKVSKSLPVSAVLVAALILGVGAVTAQTQNVTSFSELIPNATQSIHSDSAPTAQAVSSVKSAVATTKLANPAISKLPTGGDDDDEDDDDDHGRDHDDEDDEDDEGDDD